MVLGFVAESAQKSCRAFRRTYGELHVSCDSHFWVCNQHTYKVTVVTDATYWTERDRCTPARPLKYFLCFGTGRARNFPKILVDVLPREVVEILATLA